MIRRTLIPPRSIPQLEEGCRRPGAVAKARAAALYFQLDRPPISVTVDQLTARITELQALADNKAIADAALKDILYNYRYVTITKHPESLVVNARSGAIFTVEAQGEAKG